MRNYPLFVQVARATATTTGALLVAALLAGASRVLPWLLDPDVTLRVAWPFLRGVTEVAMEAALLVGWPLGWALAGRGFAERGEARALLLLGASPVQLGLGCWRVGAVAALSLGLASGLGAMDAGAPGRMASDLLAAGRASCSEPGVRQRAVPFVGLTWLCAGGEPVRLYGSAPGFPRVLFSARAARVSPDMTRVELEDARLLVSSADIHVGRLNLRGLTPWAQVSNVWPPVRVLVLEATAALSALLAIAGVLVEPRGVLRAVLLGTLGPVTALGLLRLLERHGAHPLVYGLVPLVAALVTWAAGVRTLRPSSRSLPFSRRTWTSCRPPRPRP